MFGWWKETNIHLSFRRTLSELNIYIFMIWTGIYFLKNPWALCNTNNYHTLKWNSIKMDDLKLRNKKQSETYPISRFIQSFIKLFTFHRLIRNTIIHDHNLFKWPLGNWESINLYNLIFTPFKIMDTLFLR